MFQLVVVLARRNDQRQKPLWDNISQSPAWLQPVQFVATLFASLIVMLKQFESSRYLKFSSSSIFSIQVPQTFNNVTSQFKLASAGRASQLATTSMHQYGPQGVLECEPYGVGIAFAVERPGG
jgi:hypothetical protein